MEEAVSEKHVTFKSGSDDDRAFYAGFACAIATLIRAHDQPTMAIDIMFSNGVKLNDLRGVDGFDYKPIARAWQNEPRGHARRKRRRHCGRGGCEQESLCSHGRLLFRLRNHGHLFQPRKG